MHFENGYPVFTVENVKHNYGGYCAICSDSSGNLLFHTNGRSIRNRLHNIMENGDTINPGALWQQYVDYGYPIISGGLAIPAPGQSNHYFLFHSAGDNSFATNGTPILYYSLIDMNQNGGLGKVISKNNILAEGDIPCPVIIKHGNGRDWWLIAGDYQNKTYRTYLIDPAGIQEVYQQTITPEAFSGGSGFHEASPDGTFFVNNDESGLWIYNFDRCTGLLSNPRVLPYQPPFWTGSNAFSPDGRFLYVGTHLVIYQLDMNTIDSAFIALDTIASYDYGASPYEPWYTNFFLPELAADGKIYYIPFTSTKAFNVINRPNFPLLASDMTQRGLETPQWNLGNWCHFPNYRLGRWEGSPCDTLDTSFPPKNGFRDMPWLGLQILSKSLDIKVLKMPPRFTAFPSSEPHRDSPHSLNPYSINKELQSDRQGANNFLQIRKANE